MLDGPDTVVVLTDGMPNVDSYSARDSWDGAFLYGDRGGSYACLLLAAKRWNLFSDCEIDCAGLAQAPATLIERLAAQGHGRSRFLGE